MTIVRSNLGTKVNVTCFRGTTLLIGNFAFSNNFLEDNGISSLSELTWETKLWPTDKPTSISPLYISFPTDNSISVFLLNTLSLAYPSDTAEWCLNVDLSGIYLDNIFYGSVKFKGPKA